MAPLCHNSSRQRKSWPRSIERLGLGPHGAQRDNEVLRLEVRLNDLPYDLQRASAFRPRGWAYIAVHLAANICISGLDSFTTTWPALRELVWRLQQLVLLDVVHAVCGVWALG